MEKSEHFADCDFRASFDLPKTKGGQTFVNECSLLYAKMLLYFCCFSWLVLFCYELCSIIESFTLHRYKQEFKNKTEREDEKKKRKQNSSVHLVPIF